MPNVTIGCISFSYLIAFLGIFYIITTYVLNDITSSIFYKIDVKAEV